MRNFQETIQQSAWVLTEGGVLERIRRHPSVALDPWIAHAGLIYEEAGRQRLEQLYREYIEIGRRFNLPFLNLAPTWRANPERLQLSAHAHRTQVNTDCVDFLRQIRASYGTYAPRIFIGGMMGCRGDAYRPQEALSYEDASRFHQAQAEELATSGVDFIKVATLPAESEAMGIAAVLSASEVPYVLSFVIRRTGTLLDGTPLHRVIDRIDSDTQRPPSFYMVNCVHPTVFGDAMRAEEQHASALQGRILGLQANTSAMAPEDLDELDYLDTMDPDDFAAAMVGLHRQYGIKVLGGCCGSDARHISRIAERLSV